MNEKKTKKKKYTKKKVKELITRVDTSKLKKVDTSGDIPVEDQFDFTIQGSKPITIGIDGQDVGTSKLKRITIPKTPLKPGQTYVPKKKRKPTLNTRTINRSGGNFF